MRECGILLPISSLPSPYGIGAFSKEAYRFVERLKEAGQHYWQILPLGPTGYGDSPYQSFGAFAGNPYFIDLDQLIDEGLLTKEECEKADFGTESDDINYERIYLERFPLLKKAFTRWDQTADMKEALDPETREYCFYMAVKDFYQGKSWTLWDEEIKLRRPEALSLWRERLSQEIMFYEFLQMKFNEQWEKLKAYANENGIRIIGDIPIYVAFDSADSWSHPELFQFNEKNMPVAVAGCPPDGFSATGQLWGNPLYNWEYQKENGYSWWINRIAYSFRMYDVVRVDHFRGFDEYYAIPADQKTAEYGRWEPGPGWELFRIIEEKLGKLDIIAEDLGFLTPTVLKLVEDTGFPGMKVLEFAFDMDGKSVYLPHNYGKNAVVYTGTHDNNTICGWYGAMSHGDKAFALKYMGNAKTEPQDIHWDFIRLALASTADLAIIPMQDYLGLGVEARINEPSTLGKNWRWRMEEHAFTYELAKRCKEMAWLYGRLG